MMPIVNPPRNILPWALFAATGIVFLPLGSWLYERTAEQDQLLQSLIVCLFTGFLLYLERRDRLSFRISFSGTSLNLLLAAYLCIGISTLTGSALLFLLSFCLSLVSFLEFLFGRPVALNSVRLLAGFAAFLLVVLLLPALDWPLRSLAGTCALAGLDLIGQESALQLLATLDGPKLLLLNEGRPFHVAAECNGFGILASSLLMALLFSLFDRSRGVVLKGTLFLITGILAVSFNGLRIIAIVLLAPVVGMERYDFMHETVGIISTYSCLFLIYLIHRQPEKKNPLP